MVKIDIELLVVLSIGLLFLFWFVWLKVSKKYYNWRYKPENDKGKLGEEYRKRLIKEEGKDPAKEVANAVATSSNGKSSSSGQTDASGGIVFPSAITGNDGKNSDGTGKSDKSGTGKPKRKFRNPFKRK